MSVSPFGPKRRDTETVLLNALEEALEQFEAALVHVREPYRTRGKFDDSIARFRSVIEKIVGRDEQ